MRDGAVGQRLLLVLFVLVAVTGSSWLCRSCLSACAAPLLQDFGVVFGMQHTPESWEKPLFCLSAVLRSSLETLVVD